MLNLLIVSQCQFTGVLGVLSFQGPDLLATSSEYGFRVEAERF